MKPPKNLRYIFQRCCGTCLHKKEEEAHIETFYSKVPITEYRCERDPDLYLVEADEYYFQICDYYKDERKK